MTTESTKTKKNPDYTESAKNLTNPDEVKIQLNLYYQAEIEVQDLQARLEATDLYQEWMKACASMTERKANVIETVKEHGSYQDVENGAYAIQQVKHKKQYHAEPFLENFSKYAPAVIEQTINVKALDGLIKGKLIDEDELVSNQVITTTEEYAFIVKAGG